MSLSLETEPSPFKEVLSEGEMIGRLNGGNRNGRLYETPIKQKPVLESIDLLTMHLEIYSRT